MAAWSAACGGNTPTPGPGITGTWIDAPLSGSTIPHAPYTVTFHSASLMGMSDFEVWIEGQLMATVPPQMTAPGGSQQTLFMAEYEWDPQAPGEYTIEVIPRDQQDQPGPAAQADVTVGELMVAQATPPVIQPPEEVEPTLELTLIVPPTPTMTPTPTPPPPGPHQIKYSEEEVYWRGLGCGSKELEIEAQIPEPGAYSVVLFARLKDKETDDTTDWYVAPMTPLGSDWYGASMVPERDFEDIMEYESADLQVQIVATDSDGNEVARTPVEANVLVEHCLR